MRENRKEMETDIGERPEEEAEPESTGRKKAEAWTPGRNPPVRKLAGKHSSEHEARGQAQKDRQKPGERPGETGQSQKTEVTTCGGKPTGEGMPVNQQSPGRKAKAKGPETAEAKGKTGRNRPVPEVRSQDLWGETHRDGMPATQQSPGRKAQA